MDFTYYNNIFSYFQDNIILAIAAGVFIGLLAFKKPKLFISMILLIAAMIGIFYMVNFLSDTGASNKNTLVQEKRLPFGK